MTSTTTHVPAVEAIIPTVLTDLNAALKPRGILLDVQSEPADGVSLESVHPHSQGRASARYDEADH